jgi:GTPase SAR1 family protein
MDENATAGDYPKISDNPKNSLFELAKNLVKTSQKKIEEKNLIIIGDKGSGKTNLFNTFLQSTSAKSTYTPTCGINYSYMRYQPSSTKKLILNLYEIGGGLNEINLIRTILTDKNLRNTIIVINIDLSKPREILNCLKNYLKQLNAIIKEIADQDTIIDIIENKKSKYKDTYSNSAEFKRINIFPAEIIVVGNNYENFEVIDLEKIKWTSRCLRFFCHTNSLSLVYFKKNDTKNVKILNNLITSIAFSSNGILDSSANFSQKNEILPVYILYSNDSLNEIGEPKVFQQGNKDINSLWEDTLYSVFPRNSEMREDNLSNESKENEIDQVMLNKYKEPRIDEELKLFE